MTSVAAANVYGGFDPSINDATQNLSFNLGFTIDTVDGKRYTYLKFNGTVAANDFVSEYLTDTTGLTVLSPAAATLPIRGVAVAGGATGTFGWVQTRGYVAAANVATNVAVTDMVGSTTSAGRLGAITATTTAATLAQITAIYMALIGVRVRVLATASSNTAPVFLY